MTNAITNFFLSTALAIGVGATATAQQDVAQTCAQTPGANYSVAPYLTSGLNCQTITSTMTGSLAVPRVDAPSQFDAGRIVLDGTSDLRLNGTNIFGGTAGISTAMTVAYELRLNGSVIATASRNYTGGHSVVSWVTFWTVNYPTLTGHSSSTLSPSQAAAFVGTGAQALSWKVTVTQCVTESGTQQQVQLDTLGTNIGVCIELDGSSDFDDLGGASPVGAPTLFASGDAIAGNNNALVLFDLDPNFPVALAITDQQGPTIPAFGGTFFANPAAISLTLAADANGHLVYPFVWPSLPPGTALTAQAITIDLGTMSIVMSNGVRAL